VVGAIASGKRLKDRYRLERTLGRGGMAAVWLGHDERLDRPVAVKVLSDTISSDPGFVARFRREAQTAAGLSHPNLVQVYDFSDEGERPYLVMEFVPGETLAAHLERGDRVDCDQLARELLEALAHIHEVGILHRDVKPSNIVVEPDGTARLIDFGIALPRDATALTRTGLVLGTERYTAPEVMEGQMATERSDLYSCGVVLGACKGRSSRALRELVAALVSRDPRDRPLSAEHALELLDWQDGVEEQATEVLEQPAASDSGSNRALVAGAICAVLGIAAIVVALVLSSGGSDPATGGNQQAAQVKDGQAEERPASAAPATEQPAEAAAPDPATADPATGAALNDQGYAMVQAGEYEAAVPVLEEAVAAFPAGTDDINYAYALYNLGNALRLSGRPEEAIPILEQRLGIPDQEAAVRAELDRAIADLQG